MGFRLVPKSVTLNDLERRNDRYLAFFSPNSVALRADYVKVVEDRPIDLYSLRQKCSPKNQVLAIYHLWRYLQKLPRTSAYRHLRDIIHPLLDYDASECQYICCRFDRNMSISTIWL